MQNLTSFFRLHYQKILLSLLMLLAAFFMFYGSNLALIDYDEATYAQVVQQSFASGNYFSLMRGGTNWFEKPPLYFWQAFITTRIFGFSEFALRLPSVLCGILGILFVYLLAKELSGNFWTGLLAGLILTLNGAWEYGGTQVRMDIPVVACIVAALYFFVLGWKNQKCFFLCGLALASGILYKNVIELLVFPIFLIFSLLYNKWGWLKQSWFWFGMATMVVLVAPWHIYESLLFGNNFWDVYLKYHILERFSTSLLGGNITTALYAKYLFYFTEPWIVVLFGALAWLGWHFRKNLLQPKLATASLLSLFFLFSFFAIASTKLFYYLVPLYPFLSIFLADVGMLFYQSLKSLNMKHWLAAFACLLIILGLLNTIWQKVYLREGSTLEYQIAGEEKQVGIYLKNHPSPSRAYLFIWPWPETIEYYSQRHIDSISPGDPISPYGQFVILPAGFWDQNQPAQEFVSRAHLIFKGNIIEMYELNGK